ncbi:MAG: thrombospondin type 3 repeat-containing protein [Myxococcota bacterium]
MAASYQKIDGTIVDPIRQFQFQPLDWSTPAPQHNYAGPSLGPGAALQSVDLEFANLRDANLVGADLSGAVLFGANLLGADLSGATITGTLFASAYYDKTTVFPPGFDPEGRLLNEIEVINNGQGPENPANVLAEHLKPFQLAITYINNAGCNSTLAHRCSSPGPPTAVEGVGSQVIVSESSTFTGSLTVSGRLWARDSSAVLISASSGTSSDDARFFASDDSTMTIGGSCGDPCDLTVRDRASVMVEGGNFQDVWASGDSRLIFRGGTDQGDGLAVSDNAEVELAGNVSYLYVNGGHVTMLSGEVWVLVRSPAYWDAQLVGGQIQGFYQFQMDGRMVMTGGRLGHQDDDSEMLIGGHLSIFNGAINGATPFATIGNGHADIWGAQAQPGIKLWARDTSRLSLFGSNFSTEGIPAPFGTLSVAEGVLSGTLSNGDPINNPFAHRGADCGGQPCTGRVLVLAPGLDWDQDAVPNPFDNCAEEPNADQSDSDEDGTGDVCFAPVDLDRDSIVDVLDNCRVDVNPDQLDTDADGVGDACEKELIFWADKGLEGCTTPPQRLPYELVSNDLGNGDVIDRSSQACDCFGIEYPVTPGTASVRFLHRTESGFVEEYCENVAPYALGLGPNQPICADGLDENGLHEVMATPFDAPGCEAGGGNALPSSIRSFTMEAPEPGVAVMVGVGVLGLAGISRRRDSAE